MNMSRAKRSGRRAERDGTTTRGRKLGPGVYYVRFQAGGEAFTSRTVVVK